MKNRNLNHSDNWHNYSIPAPKGVEYVKNSGIHDSIIVIF